LATKTKSVSFSRDNSFDWRLKQHQSALTETVAMVGDQSSAKKQHHSALVNSYDWRPKQY
jgi:hypothetical protein